MCALVHVVERGRARGGERERERERDTTCIYNKYIIILPPSLSLSLPPSREKAQLSEDIKTKQDLIQQRKTEINVLHTNVETVAKQREDLEREKSDAQTKLDQLDNEVSDPHCTSVANLHILVKQHKFLAFLAENWYYPSQLMHQESSLLLGGFLP